MYVFWEMFSGAILDQSAHRSTNSKAITVKICIIRTIWGIVKMFEFQKFRITVIRVIEVFSFGYFQFSRDLKVLFELAKVQIYASSNYTELTVPQLFALTCLVNIVSLGYAGIYLRFMMCMLYNVNNFGLDLHRKSGRAP